MFKLIRVVILLTILAVVGFGTLLDHARATDWSKPLYVSIYPHLASNNHSAASARFIRQLKVKSFKPIEIFFERELKRYKLQARRPVIITLHPPLQTRPPALPDGTSRIATAIWSLKLRYWAWRAASNSEGVAGEVKIFIAFEPASKRNLPERSTALKKGQIGIVNALSGRSNNAKNNIIIAHELLHVLGASDKYDLRTGQPIAPHGLAEPTRKPLYPQRYAEIMAGRIALSNRQWKNPANIGQTLIGKKTAEEIGLN